MRKIIGNPTTELAYITVKEGLERDALDKSTPAGQAFAYMVDMVVKAPGARRVHWGPSVENPRQIWILVAWDNIQDHLNYRETETLAEVTRRLSPHVDIPAGYQICHVNPPVTHPFNISGCRVVEILSLCFPSDLEAATKKVVEKNFDLFIEKAITPAGLCRGHSQGWTVETNVELQGEPGSSFYIYVATLAWETVEQHQENRELDVFKKNVQLLRNLPGLTRLNSFHVQARSVYS
ncbi:unnamed protein product [Clonostachys rosea f. rosea IK726]|uniref:ABM domain-containing protein n=2 Tax=Bionectria ochroleuca TaxID=29856 RepID=A0A0B7KBW5_BIOOC|nr:unnamed protein product [Clonostachys rosea f. rosea IK726]